MKRNRLPSYLGGFLAALALAACIPIFSDGLFQTLRLTFELDRALAEGEERRFQVVVFSEDVRVKKSFVQLSGRLTPGGGAQLPDRIVVKAVIEDENGKLIQRLSVNVAPAADGFFAASARLRKNVGAGETMTLSVEPSGADLAAGTGIALCVDMVKKRGALAALPDCLLDDEPPAGNEVTLSSLQDQHFTPTCSRSGCHSTGSARGGLVLTQGRSHGELVGVASTQRAQFNRVQPGDPENSYLVKKLRGDADIQGQRMPDGGPFLSDQELAAFIRWIQDGALDN